MNISDIEAKAMKNILVAYIIMGIVGIATFLFSNSEAVLIDGVFNFIPAFSMIIGIKISKLVTQKPTKSLPFGFAMYETLYTIFKGLMIFGVLVLAGSSNIMKIYDYLTTGAYEPIKGEFIVYYSILMVIICGSVYFYLKSKCNKTDNRSIMLQTEKIAVFQNTIISAAIGLVFFLVGHLKGTFVEPILPIADAIIVLALCFLLFNDPLIILKNAFNELIIKDVHHDMRDKITEYITPLLNKDYKLNYVSISRLGRTYYFMFLINPLKSNLPLQEIEEIQQKIKNRVKEEAPFSYSDIIFSSRDVENLDD